MRSTSLNSYIELHKRGGAQNQAYRILKAMKKGKTYSLNEIEQITGIRINAVSGRVNELKGAKFLKEGKQRECKITGSKIIPVKRP